MQSFFQERGNNNEYTHYSEGATLFHASLNDAAKKRLVEHRGPRDQVVNDEFWGHV